VNFCLVYLKILCYKSLTFFNKEKIKYKIFTLKFFIHIKFKFFTNLTLNLLLFKKGKKTLNLLDKISIINIIFEKFYWFDLLNTLLLYFTNKYHSRLKKKKNFLFHQQFNIFHDLSYFPFHLQWEEGYCLSKALKFSFGSSIDRILQLKYSMCFD
jgi:hypothetical protein